MAIAGSGGWTPSVRVCIYNRRLVLSGCIHNVPAKVVWLPEKAAAKFAEDPKAYIYVPTSDDGGTVHLAKLLQEMGLIDPVTPGR